MKPVAFIRTSPTRRGESARSEYTSALSLDEHFVVHPAATFYMRVGADIDPAEDLDVRTGDILVIDRSAEAALGSLVLMVIDGTFVLARFGDEVSAGEATLWGTVVALARTL